MKKFFLILGFLFASANTNAQLVRLPLSQDAFYKCSDIHVGYSLNGAWIYYLCEPVNPATPAETSRKITWMAAPYPIRIDLIGSRIETIKNSSDQLAAANKAWTRYVTLPANDPSLVLIKEDMLKAGVPLIP